MSDLFNTIGTRRQLRSLLELAVEEDYIPDFTMEDVDEILELAQRYGLPDITQCSPLHMVISNADEAYLMEVVSYAMLVEALEEERIDPALFVALASYVGDALEEVFDLYQEGKLTLPFVAGAPTAHCTIH